MTSIRSSTRPSGGQFSKRTGRQQEEVRCLAALRPFLVEAVAATLTDYQADGRWRLPAEFYRIMDDDNGPVLVFGTIRYRDLSEDARTALFKAAPFSQMRDALWAKEREAEGEMGLARPAGRWSDWSLAEHKAWVDRWDAWMEERD